MKTKRNLDRSYPYIHVIVLLPIDPVKLGGLNLLTEEEDIIPDSTQSSIQRISHHLSIYIYTYTHTPYLHVYATHLFIQNSKNLQ